MGFVGSKARGAMTPMSGSANQWAAFGVVAAARVSGEVNEE